MASGFYRGTNIDQDSRFGDQNKKLMKRMKFAPILNSKVDISKVNMLVMKKWITEKVTELLGGFEDEILIDMVINTLQNPVEGNLDPKQLQIQLTEFFHKHAPAFMEELWTLLVDAQHNPGGIPSIFLTKKIQELQQKDSASKSQRQEIAAKLYDSRFVKSKGDMNTEKIEENQQFRDSRGESKNRANLNSNDKEDDHPVENRRKSLPENSNLESHKRHDKRVTDTESNTHDSRRSRASSSPSSHGSHSRTKSKNRHRSRSRSRSRSESRSRSISKRRTHSSKKSKSKTKKHRTSSRSRSPSKSESSEKRH
jgi:serine/arginine repetitive matrix protein 1